jgi:hypothetical protein
MANIDWKQTALAVKATAKGAVIVTTSLRVEPTMWKYGQLSGLACVGV